MFASLVCVCACVSVGTGDDAKCVSWCGLRVESKWKPWAGMAVVPSSTAQIWTLPASGLALLPWPLQGQDGDVAVCAQRFLCSLSKAKIECLPQRQVPRTENMHSSLVVQHFDFFQCKNNVSPACCLHLFFEFTIILEQFYQAILLAPKSTPQGALAKLPPRRSPVNFLYPVPLSIRQPGSLTISPISFSHGKAIYSTCWRLHLVPLSYFWYT